MNNHFGLLLKDLKKLWDGLGLPQKLAIFALIIISFAAISYFIAKSTEPNWGVLYSDLSETDAVAVIENLKKSGYTYKISDDKKSILVPQEQKEDLRLMIAENDVIKDSTPGFELLDKLQLGATDFQNKLTRQRIFQNELTRTIERIKGIKKAKVQIADPERSIFSEQDEAPTASVLLILEPGVTLKPEQVKAIKNLVANGVPRLTAEKVFISDQFGNPLSEDMNNNSGGGIADYRTSFETDTSKKIQKVLEKIVGTSNVSVQVSAQMNFDSSRSTIERYLPANTDANTPEGVLAGTETEAENYGNNGSQQSNIQSIPSNVQTGNGKNVNYVKSKTTKSFNVSKEVKQVVYAPGTVQKLTIAVALNKILTTAETNQIRDLVISASGADTNRGDIVTVTGMQFAEDAQANNQKLMDEIEKSSQTDLIVKQIGPLLVVLILGLTALFVLNSLIRKPVKGEEVYDNDGYDDGEADDGEPDLLEAVSIPAIEAKLDPEVEKMKTDINNIILADPSEAARLLLTFIKE
ncbi:MAG: flagellar basal-body MS-ring/collar protein FliF [bacterium]